MEKLYTLYRHILRKEISGYKYDKYYYGITSQKIERRWNSGHGYYKNKKFTKDINIFDWNNIEHEILFENLTKEEAELLEQMYIKLYNTRDENHGWNISRGGFDMKGENNFMYGKKLTKEHKKKLSESLKGNRNASGKRSKESIKNISESHKGLPSNRRIKVINLDTGEIFNSIKEAGEKYNMKNPYNICACCAGKRKTAGGYRWSYYNDYLRRTGVL